MFDFLTSLWLGVVNFLSLILPFGQNSFLKKIGPGARWGLHLLLVGGILVLLYFANRWLGIHELIAQPEWARHVWLPIVFLLMYVLSWTGWWIYLILAAEPDPTDFPDIDEAWDQAVEALNHAGISLSDVPLFLVLGRPESPEEHFFAASQIAFQVKQTPPGLGAPLHVYGNRDAVFVTCAGCSLMGKQASLLALEGIESDTGGGTMDPGFLEDSSKTLKPSQNEQRVMKQLALSLGRQTTGLDKRAARRELGLKLPDLLANQEETDRLSDRLTHLCRLIARDRQPYCPINGVLLLVPLGATDTDVEAQQTAEICYRDLEVIRRVLKMQCPVISVVCDMECLPGFPEFLHKQGAAARGRRVGQRFPLASPDLDGERFAQHVGDSVAWLSNNLFRDLIHPQFQVGGENPRSEITSNKNLFLLMHEVRERGKNLSRFLMQSVARNNDDPWLFAGCYFAGTGADRDREQGFVKGVFARLVENQNCVAWTDQALSEDSRCRSFAMIGYVVLAGLAIAVAGLLGYQFLGPRK
jgi:hypothetical protein